MELVLGIADALSMSVFHLGVLVFLLLVIIVVTFLTASAKKTDSFKQLTMFLPILDQAITSIIRELAQNDSVVDWEAERAEELGIDPRMLYVLERLEEFAEQRGIDLEFEFIWIRAQDIYRDLVENGTIN